MDGHVDVNVDEDVNLHGSRARKTSTCTYHVYVYETQMPPEIISILARFIAYSGAKKRVRMTIGAAQFLGKILIVRNRYIFTF